MMAEMEVLEAGGLLHFNVSFVHDQERRSWHRVPRHVGRPQADRPAQVQHGVRSRDPGPGAVRPRQPARRHQGGRRHRPMQRSLTTISSLSTTGSVALGPTQKCGRCRNVLRILLGRTQAVRSGPQVWAPQKCFAHTSASDPGLRVRLTSAPTGKASISNAISPTFHAESDLV